MNALLAAGQVLVVETEDGERYLGTVEVAGDAFVLRSGFQGRPVVIDVAEVVSVELAVECPDVLEV